MYLKIIIIIKKKNSTPSQQGLSASQAMNYYDKQVLVADMIKNNWPKT